VPKEIKQNLATIDDELFNIIKPDKPAYSLIHNGSSSAAPVQYKRNFADNQYLDLSATGF
jgi:hypothetical protein